MSNPKRAAGSQEGVLSARLFQPGPGLEEVLTEVKGTAVYRREEKFREQLNWKLSDLQQWIRASFLCDGFQSPRLKVFVNSVVKPATDCVASRIPQEMALVLGRFTAMVAGEEADEQDVLNIKLACSTLRGELDKHPLIQGLMLQCRRLCLRNAEGKSMRGRRELQTSREEALVADAGLCLALHAGNAALAKEFGITASLCRIDLKELSKHSVPQFALALNFPDIVKQNFMLLDQRYDKVSNSPRCNLALDEYDWV